MRLDFAYRLLSHATLGISCAALLYSEEALIPAMEWGTVPALLLVALAFAIRGRWTLPRWTADLLALAAAIAVGAWFTMQLRDPDSWVHYLTPTAALVPHLGPVLVVLLLVKLFRRHGPREFWQLQGIGLVQMALASMLATQPFFALLILAYLVCGLGALTAHYLRARPAHAVEPRSPSPRPPGTRQLAATALLWSLVVAPPALFLFLITPRPPDSWDPLRNLVNPPTRPLQLPTETGYRDRIDLGSTGTVQLSEELAFTVFATDAENQPKLDLPLDQRWRGAFLDRYENGVWTSRYVAQAGSPLLPLSITLPRFSDPFYLTFTVQPQRAGGLFLADPVVIRRAGMQQPVRSLAGPAGMPLFVEIMGSMVPVAVTERECRYRQVVPDGEDPDWVYAMNLPPRYIGQLVQQPVPQLERWTRDLVQRLAREGKHGLSGYTLPDGRAREADWEKLGRGLSDYLAHEGDYGYSLEKRRQDVALDPTLDFLRNVKQGHCERFACGLALMLRSLGVPARVVKGFRGTESQGNGTYLVRQKHAHSWVEILVPRGQQWHSYKWLTLDPTPAGVPPPAETTSLKRWWEDNQQIGMVWLRRLFIEYDTHNQAEMWQKLTAVGSGKILLALPALATLGLVLVVWRRRRARTARGRASLSAIAFHARLLALLARHLQLRPATGQTARELAAQAATALALHPATAALAALPMHLVEVFYRVRFGGKVLADKERRGIEADLDRLEAALRSAPLRAGSVSDGKRLVAHASGS